MDEVGAVDEYARLVHAPRRDHADRAPRPVHELHLGRQELLDLRIEKEVVDPGDVGMLRDLVRAAVNDALGTYFEENPTVARKIR